MRDGRTPGLLSAWVDSEQVLNSAKESTTKSRRGFTPVARESGRIPQHGQKTRLKAVPES